MHKLKSVVSVMVLFLLCSCATSNHGTFVASTYTAPSDKTSYKPAGKVTGESTQTWFLYIFPVGDSPSTNSAIQDAKSQIEGTKFLTDLSIDDKTYWKFGYSEQAVKVEATAYK
ncbi:hypothetical protein DSLASN_25500 [Desulfoluna limicola]|uniref:Lipoprotein n=1 Tax=Desulfoluna limicola TaxID=2810562 RepID=A0ABM7PID0_9BACT|nr:hypothetical protein [Desulfoluna limicola]BCS96918.1 hypothetical protein DSLASN_25500 [Desulfoluna limicola]